MVGVLAINWTKIGNIALQYSIIHPASRVPRSIRPAVIGNYLAFIWRKSGRSVAGLGAIGGLAARFFPAIDSLLPVNWQLADNSAPHLLRGPGAASATPWRRCRADLRGQNENCQQINGLRFFEGRKGWTAGGFKGSTIQAGLPDRTKGFARTTEGRKQERAGPVLTA